MRDYVMWELVSPFEDILSQNLAEAYQNQVDFLLLIILMFFMYGLKLKYHKLGRSIWFDFKSLIMNTKLRHIFLWAMTQAFLNYIGGYDLNKCNVQQRSNFHWSKRIILQMY